jgi:hypothetical protein
MDYQATYQNLSEYLFVAIRGQWTEKSARQVIEDIKREAETVHQTRVLLDLMDVLAPKLMFTRFTTGKDIAEVWGTALKVATVAKPEFTTRFTENVAVNRGTRIKAFTDETQALQWLLQD